MFEAELNSIKEALASGATTYINNQIKGTQPPPQPAAVQQTLSNPTVGQSQNFGKIIFFGVAAVGGFLLIKKFARRRA